MNFNPYALLQSAKPWASSTKDGRTPNAENYQGGIYQDAIIISEDGTLSTWLYHGYPIVQYNHTNGNLFKSLADHNSVTTRARLNSLPGRRIYQRKGEPFDVGTGLPWQNDTLATPSIYHRTDAWRYYRVPLTVVAGASDTGNWSDSPCRPEDEIETFRTYLRSKGIRSSLAWTATSNLFCIKRWVQVHPRNLNEAQSLASEYFARHSSELRLLHLPF